MVGSKLGRVLSCLFSYLHGAVGTCGKAEPARTGIAYEVAIVLHHPVDPAEVGPAKPTEELPKMRVGIGGLEVG
ncbi:hypothetical protein CDL15_Pgr009269 [Punica granatum]|uniref:Secreted protein n=1 Tax=Punica granatum TaxID=22663 RepID=A0A218VVC1_PUNGR|nr:hypothetical protein CDL15_Pgr009269 [Punica granatum]